GSVRNLRALPLGGEPVHPSPLPAPNGYPRPRPPDGERGDGRARLHDHEGSIEPGVVPTGTEGRDRGRRADRAAHGRPDVAAGTAALAPAGDPCAARLLRPADRLRRGWP